MVVAGWVAATEVAVEVVAVAMVVGVEWEVQEAEVVGKGAEEAMVAGEAGRGVQWDLVAAEGETAAVVAGWVAATEVAVAVVAVVAAVEGMEVVVAVAAVEGLEVVVAVVEGLEVVVVVVEGLEVVVVVVVAVAVVVGSVAAADSAAVMAEREDMEALGPGRKRRLCHFERSQRSIHSKPMLSSILFSHYVVRVCPILPDPR